MSRTSPLTVRLSPLDRAALEARARKYSLPYRDVIRAKIVLLAADGRGEHGDRRPARRRRCSWCPSGASGSSRRAWTGLKDRPRTGRPRAFPPVAVVRSRRWPVSCPPRPGVPLSRWSAPDLAVEAVARGVVESISASTVRRWLAGDALQPWQHRSWIFPRDPDFAAKAARAWTCTPALARASPWARTSSWSARTRRPRSRPGVAATRRLPPGEGADDAGRARVRTAGCAAVPGRLRRAPRPR